MVTERKNGVQKKKTDKSGLGRAIINRRAKQAKIAADPTLVSLGNSTGDLGGVDWRWEECDGMEELWDEGEERRLVRTPSKGGRTQSDRKRRRQGARMAVQNEFASIAGSSSDSLITALCLLECASYHLPWERNPVR